MKLRWVVGAASFVGIVVALSVTGRQAAPTDATIERLVCDPERLQATLRQCRAQVVPTKDPACRAASEAWRRRFFHQQDASHAAIEPSTTSPSAAKTPSATPPEIQAPRP